MKHKYYITTPIYYVNDVPHIGHAYTSILADTYARTIRIAGHTVKLLTGTDEHGQKVEKAAQNAGMLPQQFVDSIAASFVKLASRFNISNGDFIRTTESRHINTVQKIWRILDEQGSIYLGKYSGWYSIRDEAFYNESELVDGKSPISGSPVEWVEEPSYFFALSKWQDKLLKWYEQNDDIIRPKFYRNEVINFIKGGLIDLSISRTNFKWGITVPDDSKHVIYVWLDALVNYLSALNYTDDNSELMRDFWPATIHIVGKDILRFHAVYWPAFLMAVGLELPKTILVHGWWTNDGQKISKSLGNVIDPFVLSDEFGVDAVRYFLLREIPVGKDGNFSKINFINRVNSELCNKIGNLVHRTVSFVYKHCQAEIPDLNLPVVELYKSESLLVEAGNIVKNIDNLIDSRNITTILAQVIELVDHANVYIDNNAPWKLKNTDPIRSNRVLYVLVETIRYIGILLQPFIPESASKILDLINVTKEQREIKYLDSRYALLAKTKINNPQPIFLKIEMDEE